MECSIIANWVKLVDSIVPVIYILADFLSSCLSNIESRILKFSTVIIQLLISLFNYFHFFPFCILGLCCQVYNCYSVLMNCSSLSPVTHFVVKSILFDISIMAPALFWLSAWYIFFHPFTFNLFDSLNRKSISVGLPWWRSG